jgi:CxxC motif-containing protein
MRDLVCIVCPRGCRLKVDDNMVVTGNYCKRGTTYALNELIKPMRMVTSTVKIDSIIIERLPVVTEKPIPKEKIFAVMEAINQVQVKAPVKIHDVIIENVLNLGVNIIATRSIEK